MTDNLSNFAYFHALAMIIFLLSVGLHVVGLRMGDALGWSMFFGIASIILHDTAWLIFTAAPWLLFTLASMLPERRA